MDLIKNLEDISNDLMLTQVEIRNFIEQITAINKDLEINKPSVCKSFEDRVFIMIPEYPPRVDIFNKTEIRDGRITSHIYQVARNRWKKLIREAVKNHKICRIDPAFVHITYYVPTLCDVSNFLGKIIIDGLMDYGVVATDDNYKKIPTVIEQVKDDKENPRTEIRVSKDTGKIEKLAIDINEGREKM